MRLRDRWRVGNITLKSNWPAKIFSWAEHLNIFLVVVVNKSTFFLMTCCLQNHGRLAISLSHDVLPTHPSFAKKAKSFMGTSFHVWLVSFLYI